MLSGLSTSGHLGRVVVERQQKKLNILNWIEKTNRQNQTNQKRDRAEQKTSCITTRLLFCQRTDPTDIPLSLGCNR